jgi:hypothetical protein
MSTVVIVSLNQINWDKAFYALLLLSFSRYLSLLSFMFSLILFLSSLFASDLVVDRSLSIFSILVLLVSQIPKKITTSNCLLVE